MDQENPSIFWVSKQLKLWTIILWFLKEKSTPSAHAMASLPYNKAYSVAKGWAAWHVRADLYNCAPTYFLCITIPCTVPSAFSRFVIILHKLTPSLP